MKRKFLLMVAALSLSFIVMPDLLSMFAGSHTYYSDAQSSCVKCHTDIADQIEAGQDLVVLAHVRAANNTNYTTYLSVGGVNYSANTIYTNYDGDGVGGNDIWTWNSGEGKWQRNSDGKLLLVSLDADSSGDINTFELCDLCHNSTIFGVSGSTHLNTTMRACDDDRCHGNKINSFNDPDLFQGDASTITGAGYSLSVNNSHMQFYLNFTNYSTSFVAGAPFNSTPGNIAPDGVHISRGYWGCLGCHSEVGTSVNLTGAPLYEHTDAGAAKKRYI